MRENDNKIEDLTFLEKSRAFGHEIIENPLNNDDIPFKIVSVDDIMNIRKDPENPSKYNVIIVLDTGTGVNEYILKKYIYIFLVLFIKMLIKLITSMKIQKLINCILLLKKLINSFYDIKHFNDTITHCLILYR